VVGRGKVITDTSVKDLITAASGDRVEMRTAERAEAMKVLADAGAEVTATAPDVLLVKGLSADRIVEALTAKDVTFAEVTTHRASLEEAYLEVTRDAVEYRAAPAAGGVAR
jgi:ABC-2 type transport system ATP-binding protein